MSESKNVKINETVPILVETSTTGPVHISVPVSDHISVPVSDPVSDPVSVPVFVPESVPTTVPVTVPVAVAVAVEPVSVDVETVPVAVETVPVPVATVPILHSVEGIHSVINSSISSLPKSDLSDQESLKEYVSVTSSTVISEVKSNETVKNSKEALSDVGVKIMGTVSEVFSDKNLSGMIKLIVDDPEFIAKVESSVRNILKDGKVDETDIPEFVFLIMEAYNSLPKARLTKEELPEFVSCVYNYLVEKYNLIPKDQRAKYETIVTSSVKLVLMVPQFKSFTSWKCPCW